MFGSALIERRKRDLPILNSYERRLAEMVCLVARVDRGERGLPERLEEFQSDFAEPCIALDSDKELVANARLVAAGLLRIESFVAKWEGLEQMPTEEEAIERIQKRQQAYAPIIPFISSLGGPAPIGTM